LYSFLLSKKRNPLICSADIENISSAMFLSKSTSSKKESNEAIVRRYGLKQSKRVAASIGCAISRATSAEMASLQ